VTHPYQDPARSVRERVADLLPRMTVQEHHAIGPAPHAAPAGRTAEQMLSESGMTHFNVLGAAAPREMAAFHNRPASRICGRLACPAA
jgi:beta-glucosidase